MSGPTSALLAEAERTIERQNKENEILRRELHETKSLYSQLVQESERESFDERRIIVLKSQLIQTERQLLLLNEASSERMLVKMEIENAMLAIADTCRKYISANIKSADLLVPRSTLMKLVEDSESVRFKLSRTIENNSLEKLSKPLSVMNGFVKNDNTEPYSMFDVCSGNVNHLNLKHVSKLEAELADLYQSLVSAENCLCKLLVQKENHDSRLHLSKAAVEREYIIMQSAVDKTQKCCEQLLDLSLLVPAAPCPAFKSKLKGVTSEKVLSSLPTSVRNKQDTKQVVDALMKSYNYTIHMKNLEIKALKDELEFHQKVYELQCQYVDDVFQAMRKGYVQFEKSAFECVVKPLEEIFQTYECLKDEANENALRDFLVTFKANADDVKAAVEKMKPPETGTERSEALSTFGDEFFTELHELQNTCAENRDKFLSDLEIVKKQREENSELLEMVLVKASQLKETEKSAKLEYEKIIAMDDSVIECETENLPPPCKPKKKKSTPVSRVVGECDGCVGDSSQSQTINQRPKQLDVKTVSDKHKSTRLNTPPESKIPRTPIKGSSFPRTPVTPSSTISSRRASSDNSGRTPASSSGPGSASSTSSRTSLTPGVPSRTLKLKK